MKILSILLLVMCFLPAEISAHSFAKYVSTPVTPPLEFVWVFCVYAITFVVLNTLIKKKFFGACFSRTVRVSMGFLVCFAMSFFLIGSFAASLHTGPPPGLGLPCPTFWGFGWAEEGDLFLRWNFFGLAILGVWCFIYYILPPSENNIGPWAGIIGNILLYILCLIPYVYSGALLHGWAGSYVNHKCENRMGILHSALIEYASQNNDRFPEAKDMDALLIQIQPYIELDKFTSLASILECPKGKAYEKAPKRFEWIAKFSGVKLQDIDPDQFYKNDVPISCPYHDSSGIMVSSILLTKPIEEAKSKATAKKSLPSSE